MLLGVLFLITACQKDIALGGADGFMPSNMQTVTLKQEGETKIIEISSIGDEWQIVEGERMAWLTATRKGETLALKAEPNTSADERQTQILLVTPSGKQTIKVTQFGSNPFIGVDKSNGTVIFNHQAHKDVELNIITNSDNWRVEQVDKQHNQWLTFSCKQKERKLILNLTAINRNSEWAQTSRSEKLFLSNGNTHYQLIVTQNGYVQFQFPVWSFNNFDINTITALEGERNNQRDKAFEIDSLLMYGQDIPKAYYVFHSPGEQAPHILYQPSNNGNGVFCAWLKAPKGKLFQKESYDTWLKQNGFLLGNKQRLDTETQYYCEGIDKTRLVTIYNSVDNYKMHGGIFRSACMQYIETPNSLRLGANAKVESLPVFPSNYLHNKEVKLKQIIAYERSRGMKPDFDNKHNTEKVTATTEDPLCRYSRLLFVPENDSYERGALAFVIYRFNWQGVTTEDIDAGLVADKELSGTVGSCQVFYKGNDIFYQVEEQGTPGVYSWYEYNIPFTTRKAFENKGYSLVREASGGFASFYRGDENLIDMQPQETRTVLTYYKSKHYVDIIKKRFNF